MKKYLLGIIAIVTAIGLSAFKDSGTVRSSKKTAELFIYVGGDGGPTNPENFEYKTGQEQECTGETSGLCEIWADPSNPGDPVASHLPNLSTAEYIYYQ